MKNTQFSANKSLYLRNDARYFALVGMFGRQQQLNE